MSLEDLFKKNLCICKHSIDIEHIDGVCYALDFNGTIYAACDCRKVTPMKLIFRVERDEVSNTNKTIPKPTIKPKQLPKIFQWGKRNFENSR